MATYTVPLTGYADIAITVETDETDPEIIADLARDQVTVSLCHQCGASRNDSLIIGDDWNPVRDRDTGVPEMTRHDN